MISPAFPARILLAAGFLAGCAHSGASSRNESDEGPGATVTARDIGRRPEEPIEKYLRGRISGVQVFETPDGIAVRIRGTTTIVGSNEPLYVIDGMAVEPGPNGALTGINAYDIESIQVLKDAASTAQYGVRGANGVIVIKMKRSDG
jgi:TonB-dependent SusC/RagA subfamily outer membrane receptor